MSYSKYFKSGQKIMMKAISPFVEEGRFEALRVFFKEAGQGTFDLTLPYTASEGEGYPFHPQMPFELYTDAFGLGIRLTCTFLECPKPNMVRVLINHDLEVIHRRQHKRREGIIGLRYTKGRGLIRTLREQWEKNVRILSGGKDLSKLPPFPRSPVNISGGGIALFIKPPIQEADLCLLLMDLGDGQAPISTLAEVIWLAETEENTDRVKTGMQFLHILESDRKRIVAFVESGKTEEEEEPSTKKR